jgi:hypothetical protein
VTVFVWLVTLARVAASFGRAEPLSRELVLAWVVLVLAPYLYLRQMESR